MRYAGIGSRRTPADILEIIEDFAAWAALGSTLLSGGAKGADQAFEFGARVMGGGLVETYLPWPKFEGIEDATLNEPDQAAMEVGQCFHPNWARLTQGAKKLIARDSYQVLGKDLASPVDLVVCWTPDGQASGGTGQALRIASEYEIDVLNLGLVPDLEVVRDYIGTKSSR